MVRASSFPRSTGPPLLPFKAGDLLDRRIRRRGQHRLPVYVHRTGRRGIHPGAIRELHLHQDFKTILTPEWQTAIKRYEPVQIPRTSKPPLPQHKIPIPRAGRGKVRREISKPSPGLPISRSGQFTIEADLPKPPRKKPFKVGDRPTLARPTTF
jgi:hypothetical protein